MRDDGRKHEAKAIPIMEVVSRLGIGGLRPTGGERHGPCPVCGGRDRFGVNPARGLWNCRTCNEGGDGLKLVQHVLGCNFVKALDFLVGSADVAPDPAVVAKRKAKAEAADKKRREVEAAMRARAIRDAREIWHAAQPGQGSPAEAYLAGRGIRFAVWPPALRFLPDHPYMKAAARGRAIQCHRGPCMIAAIQDAAGQVRAVHQTWIDPARPGEKARIIGADGKALPSKLVRGSKKGGAIRLSPWNNTGRMVMGEGIETTASAMMMRIWPGAIFWAGVDLGNMSGRQLKEPGKRHSGKPDMEDLEAFVPPEGIARYLSLQDGDSAEKATRAKLEAGAIRARLTRPGLVAEILRADAGKDFNDMWREALKEDAGK
jgi:ribosomal protein L37AE/L43A